MTGGTASPDGHSLNSSHSSTNAPTMYAISRYCLIVEAEAIEREWWRDVEKSELAKLVNVLDWKS